MLVGLVSLQAFAAFLDTNRSQILQPGRVLTYALVTTVLSLLILTLAVRWSGRRERDRVALAVAMVIASFLNFSVLFDPEPPDGRKLLGGLLAWLVLTALLARLAYLGGGDVNVRTGALIFVAVLFLAPSASYVGYRASGPSLTAVADPGPLPVPPERPNVYWMMLDGFDRPDVMREVVGYDVRPFVSDLEDRGFQVSSASLSSYPRTHLSLASTLEMEYVLEPGHQVTDDFGTFAPVVVGHNATVARFHDLGYQTIYGPAGGVEWSACRRDLVDVCLPINRPSPSTGELETTLLDRTPLGLLPLPIPYGSPQTFTDGLVDPALGITPPFFAFQHILTPHYPYRYRKSCTPRRRPLDARRLSPEERLEEYATQARCISLLTTEAIDRIIERDPTAVILIQSDHGSDHTVTWQDDPRDWTPRQVTERYAAFNAMRLPAGCDVEIEGQPLVNTFRIVFACIEGTAPPHLLEYRGFTMPIGDVTDIHELTPDRFEDPPHG